MAGCSWHPGGYSSCGDCNPERYNDDYYRSITDKDGRYDQTPTQPVEEQTVTQKAPKGLRWNRLTDRWDYHDEKEDDLEAFRKMDR